jgi:Xaa-Pro aminopeptidase
MLSADHLRRRRREFLAMLARPVLLFAGGECPRNLPANCYPYRADSNFLFFFGSAEPDACAFFDPDGEVTLFLKERSVESALWMGPLPPFDEARESMDVDRVLDVERLEEHIRRLARGRKIESLAVADSASQVRARAIAGADLEFRDPKKLASLELRRALAKLRVRKAAEELGEMREAASVTSRAFHATMSATRPGVSEGELYARVVRCFTAESACEAYATTLSVRGEVLHNHRHHHRLERGDLVLMDAGAEVSSGYACDVTRTWPVSGRFNAEQRSVYEVVLAAQEAAIALVRHGVPYRDVHLRAAEVITEGLIELGVLRGTASHLVERGAHALFFPHGVGHLLGLDVHDLRSFGDEILYAEGRSRSDQFGMNVLRFDLDLSTGMVVTIEPGVYFVPAILHDKTHRERFSDVVRFDRAERYLAANDGRGFGGIRIEDDVLATDSDPDVLTSAIPKSVSEIERVVGSHLSARAETASS